MSLDLKNVTLIALDGRDDSRGSVKSLEWCMGMASFHETILFSQDKPDNNDIRHIKTGSLNMDDYSTFMIKEMPKHIESDFVLIAQENGFIINPDMWDDDFFNYDYLGAVWPDHNVKNSEWIPLHIRHSDVLNRVGNGGFSLRSKKLIDACMNCHHPVNGPEDAYICNVHRDYFEGCGVIFAPTEVANRFSFEQWTENPNEDPMKHFGVHGRYLA